MMISKCLIKINVIGVSEIYTWNEKTIKSMAYCMHFLFYQTSLDMTRERDAEMQSIF